MVKDSWRMRCLQNMKKNLNILIYNKTWQFFHFYSYKNNLIRRGSSTIIRRCFWITLASTLCISAIIKNIWILLPINAFSSLNPMLPPVFLYSLIHLKDLKPNHNGLILREERFLYMKFRLFHCLLHMNGQRYTDL